jgi:hypothetical protein
MGRLPSCDNAEVERQQTECAGQQVCCCQHAGDSLLRPDSTRRRMSLDGRQGEVTNGRFVGFRSTKVEFSRMAGDVVGPALSNEV